MTCKRDAETVVEALNLADRMVRNCVRTGVLIENAARYVRKG